MALEWMDPPKPVNDAIAEAVAQLKERPGKWARVHKAVSATGYKTKWANAGCDVQHVKTSSRGTTPPVYDIYARWPKPKFEYPKPKDGLKEDADSGKKEPTKLVRVNGRLVSAEKAAEQSITPRPSHGGAYDPAGRAARGIPPEGLRVGD